MCVCVCVCTCVCAYLLFRYCIYKDMFWNFYAYTLEFLCIFMH